MDRRLAYVLVALVAVAALFFVFRPGGDDETTATSTTATPPTLEPTTSAEQPATTEPEAPEPVRAAIRIRAGKPVDGLTRIAAKKGDQIVLIVRADAPDHVHVHGYDLIADVGPGRPASLRFRATITGRFEIELEDAHQQIAQLTVTS